MNRTPKSYRSDWKNALKTRDATTWDAALNPQMTALKEAIRSVGANSWEAAIVVYHPKIEGAHVVKLTDGASVQHLDKLFSALQEEGF